MRESEGKVEADGVCLSEELAQSVFDPSHRDYLYVKGVGVEALHVGLGDEHTAEAQLIGFTNALSDAGHGTYLAT